MKLLWMTATALALCVIATDGIAEPASPLAGNPNAGLLVRVATTTHHKHHKKATATSSKKGKAKSSKKGKHGRRHATAKAEGGRHHHARASSEIHSAGAASVKVGRHDTLFSISRKTGVPVEELARLNGLHKPYHVRLGERIKLPARRYYVVKSGETLYSLSRKFGVDVSDLAAANGVKTSVHLRSGQRLYLPAGAAEAAPPEAERPLRPRTSAIQPVAPYSPPPLQPQPATPPTSSAPGPSGFQLTPPPTSAPAQPGAQAPSGRAILQTSPAPTPEEVAAAGKGKFVWPLSGSMISGYGPKPDGEKNDGVNISASVGDPVRAAADGEVVYAGDQVPSFGNLVLVKHAGGWVTAYAHMSRILVKNRDQVVQGQEIGAVGQTGKVGAPQLHFEVRYAPSAKDKAVPIDPMLVLPAK
jgi:murein DD-endopeptidase MepM/ murein hydrolase activator NlpD